MKTGRRYTERWQPAGRFRLASLREEERTWASCVAALWCLGLLTGCSNSQRPAAPKSALSTQEIARRVLPAVVTVIAKDAEGGILQTGSGFLGERGVIVTNEHVIEGASQLSVRLTNGTEMRVTAVRAADAQHDLALLECPEANSLQPLSLGDDRAVRVGDNVVAAGSPLGYEGTISQGIVSATRTRDSDSDVRVLQTTAPISPGSSGGPLLNERSEVIGVNSFTVVNGQNLNFAYPTTYVKELLQAGKGKAKTADIPSPSTSSTSVQTVANSSPYRDAILSLLAAPDSSGDAFARQALGKARLEMADLDTKRAYFSFPYTAVSAPAGDPKAQTRQISTQASRFLKDTTAIHLATLAQGSWEIDTYTVPKTRERNAVFRTPIDNLRFPSNLTFRFPYRSAIYEVTPEQLHAYLEGVGVYGGYVNADVTPYWQSTGRELMVNRGALVVKPGDPPLEGLTRALIKGASSSSARTQRLTDFVCGEIANSYSESSQEGEVVKRPNEVLMTGRGSRTNKGVLLASLFEQAGVSDYLLAYDPDGTIWVAVPQQGFPKRQGLTFEWDGVHWAVIDVQAKRFKIGETPLTLPLEEAHLLFVQQPREASTIVHRATRKPLGFR